MIRAPGVFAREYIGGEDKKDVKLLPNPTDGSRELPDEYNDVMYGGTLYNKAVSDPDNEAQLPDGSLYRSTESYGGGLHSNYYIRGTCYGATGQDAARKVTYKHINSYGFGESTYPGCRYAREGHGMCLAGVN